MSKKLSKNLIKEWNYTKNGDLTPKDLTVSSGKKVWWKCNKEHEWEATIGNRHNNGSGCPYCAGKKACQDNCLKTINPKLAKEWHPIKNGNLTAEDVMPGSGKKVWWICEKGHEWEAKINNRNNGNGCPYCSRRLKPLLVYRNKF